MQNREIEDGSLDPNNGQQTISYLLKTIFSLTFIKSLKDNILKKAHWLFCHALTLQKWKVSIIVLEKKELFYKGFFEDLEVNTVEVQK